MANRRRKCGGCDKFGMSADMLIYGLSAFCDDTCRKVFTDKAVERTRAKQQSKAKRVHREKDKAFKRETRERKEAIKPRGDYIKAAQKEFNRFIRLRDNDQPCISCGRDASQVEPTDGWKPGGAWDCGHFQGVGRRPELRFTETNAYRQCKSCNGGSGKYARKSHTVEQEYEERLRVRIGDAEVDRLKGPAPPAKWTIDDIKAIQTKYRLKANILEKALDL